MTKSQLLGTLSESTGLSKKDVTNLMDKMVELAYKEVKKNGQFVVP